MKAATPITAANTTAEVDTAIIKVNSHCVSFVLVPMLVIQLPALQVECETHVSVPVLVADTEAL